MTSTNSSLLSAPRPLWLSALRAIGLTLVWFVLALLTLWAIAALYVDIRIEAWRVPMVSIYTLGIIAILIKVRPWLWAAVLCLAGFCMVLTWWFSLSPSNN